MNKIKKTLITFFFLSVIITFFNVFSPQIVNGQAHNCGICCVGSTTWCDDAECTLSCSDVPPCTLIGSSSLGVTGDSNPLKKTVSWWADPNATHHYLTIQNVETSAYIQNRVDTPTRTYSFTGEAGASYDWFVESETNCAHDGSELRNGTRIDLPHACGSCCAGSIKYCDSAACNTGCFNYPACPNSNPTGLSYSGTGQPYEVNVTWDDDSDATDYKLRVWDIDTGANKINNIITTSRSHNFTGTAGARYDWEVTSRNACQEEIGTTNGTDIGIPKVENLTIHSEDCDAGECDAKDIIVNIDSIIGTQYNQIVQFRAEFFDYNNRSDIAYAHIYFDNNSSGDTFYRIRGNTSVIEEYDLEGSKKGWLDITGSSDVEGAGNNLILDAYLDLSGLPANQAFLSNVYLGVEDNSGIVTGRVLLIGTGNFPIGNINSDALDIWNGKDVNVGEVGFYKVDNMNSFLLGGERGSPVGRVDLTAAYSPGNPSDFWQSPLDNWNDTNTAFYQPYNNYGGNNYEVTFETFGDETYFITGMDNTRYGGSGDETSNGTIDNFFMDGGLRLGDYNANQLTRADMSFAVSEITDVWSVIVNGNFMTNSDLDISIEPSVCLDCTFMSSTSSGNSGVILANGTVTENATDILGAPVAKEQTNKPFAIFQIPKYDQIKDLFNGEGYTEIADDSDTVSLTTAIANDLILDEDDDGIADTNKVYFINDNFAIDNNQGLRVPEDEYLLFIISGDLTITEDITNVNAGGETPVQGIFVAQGNIWINDNKVANYDANNTSEFITIEGSLTSGGIIHFDRTMGVANTTSNPIEIIYRPDMVQKMIDENINIIMVQKIFVGEY